MDLILSATIESTRRSRNYLSDFGNITRNVPMKQITIDKKHTWLTEGLDVEFDTFIPMGSKEAKNTKDRKTIFNLYSLGVATNRDILAYSFDLALLQERVHTFIEIYNTAVDRKLRHNPKAPVESFIDTTDHVLSGLIGLRHR